MLFLKFDILIMILFYNIIDLSKMKFFFSLMNIYKNDVRIVFFFIFLVVKYIE